MKRNLDMKKNSEKGYVSYTIDGTDLILADILRNVNNGFYVDIGANHPISYNNTYYFYKRGWNGFSVDGNQKFEPLWLRERPLDTFITALVSSEVKQVDFKIFKDHKMSSMNIDQIKLYEKRFSKNEITSHPGTTTTLSNLKNEYFAEKEVHFLTIDVEGEDLNCLIGANLSNWKPGVVVMEVKNMSIYNVISNDVVEHLNSYGYRLISKTPLNAIFVYPSKPYLTWIPETLTAMK